jgi:type III pantothenate kinase
MMGQIAAKLLTLDCGNSTLDCLDHAKGRRERFEVPGQGAATIAAMRAFVAGTAPSRCVAVSVVPEGLTAFAALLAIPIEVAGRDLLCPLPLDYLTPHTLGADRWLAALAAHRRFGRAVVVDCGSATTVNLVEDDGTFRGGAIAPGLRAFVAGLAATTPALPAPDLDASPAMPPRSSQDAVTAGVLLGYCGLVERLVADTLRVARGSARVLVTGGNAARLLRSTRLQATHVDDLVHQGLAILASEQPCGS